MTAGDDQNDQIELTSKEFLNIVEKMIKRQDLPEDTSGLKTIIKKQNKIARTNKDTVNSVKEILPDKETQERMRRRRKEFREEYLENDS